MNRIPLFALSALLHLSIGMPRVSGVTAWPAVAASLAALLLATAIVIPAGIAFRRRKHRLAEALNWTSLIAIGLFSSLLVLTLLRDALLLVVGAAAWSWPGAIDMQKAIELTALLVPALAVAITLIGLWKARRTVSIVDVDIPITGLPDALDGFTIAQISDVHVGPTIKGPYVESIVDAVNRLEADMVAVTGDLVDGSVAELHLHVAPLARLSSRHGTFFVTGNHEYYSGVQGWIRELRRLGMHVLLNEHVVLRHGSSELLIAGVTDPTGRHFDRAHECSPRQALAGPPDG